MPGERIELPTNGLQNRCSTAELTRQINDLGFSGHQLGTENARLEIHGELIVSACASQAPERRDFARNVRKISLVGVIGCAGRRLHVRYWGKAAAPAMTRRDSE